MKKVKYSKNINQRKEKKKFKKEVIWTLFIAIVMISSIIGFIYSGGNEADYTYKDKFKFIRTDRNSFIYIDENDNQYTLRYLPYEVEQFNITTKIVPPMIYLSFDPNSSNIEVIELMRFELLEDLKKINIHVTEGITEESESYNMTIIDCTSATPFTPIIQLIGSNNTEITENNNCVTLESKDWIDAAKLKDRLLYAALGII